MRKAHTRKLKKGVVRVRATTKGKSRRERVAEKAIHKLGQELLDA